MSFVHETVLLDEAVTGLNIKPDGIYVDGTFGRGGHSRAILAALGPTGRLIGIDRDPTAIATAEKIDDPRFSIVHGDFAGIGDYMREQGLVGQVDGVLLDLGVSSPQLDDAERGFSFLRDGPLDMRMDNSRGQTAAEWLNSAEEHEIARVLREYGEERFARRIARGIVARRLEQPFSRTAELAKLIAECSPKKELNKHPATRSFQAIRIHINGELEQIEQALAQSVPLLAAAGRLVVISFHSLEDRIVKRFMRDQARPPRMPRGLPLTEAQLTADIKLELVGKAVKPSLAEVQRNPRARSSVMRIAQRRGAP